MLKFQDKHTAAIATFEDFILTVYVIIDELYRCFSLPEVTKRCQVKNANWKDTLLPLFTWIWCRLWKMPKKGNLFGL